MRFRMLDRLVSVLSGIVMLGFGVGLFVFGIGVLPFRMDLSFLERTYPLWQRAIMVVVSLLFCGVGLRCISLLFRSSKEKGFILQHTEYGDLSISMSAMENMVKKCVDAHSELKVGSTRIHHARDGVIINLRIALANGVNIPIAVNALQKQIKQYITSCSGVDVKEVRVMVETNNSLAPYIAPQNSDILMADVDAAAKAGVVADSLHGAALGATSAETQTEVKAEKEPFHMRLFRREEKPLIIPQPPVDEPKEAAQAVASALEREPVAAEPEPETESDSQAQPEEAHQENDDQNGEEEK